MDILSLVRSLQEDGAVVVKVELHEGGAVRAVEVAYSPRPPSPPPAPARIPTDKGDILDELEALNGV